MPKIKTDCQSEDIALINIPGAITAGTYIIGLVPHGNNTRILSLNSSGIDTGLVIPADIGSVKKYIEKTFLNFIDACNGDSFYLYVNKEYMKNIYIDMHFNINNHNYLDFKCNDELLCRINSIDLSQLTELKNSGFQIKYDWIIDLV